MQTEHLYVRLTHKYRDGWRHLDNEKFLATVRLTAPIVRDTGNGHDSGPTYTQWVRLPRGLDSVRAAQALRDTLGGSRCRHEYDCCGCVLRYVSVEHKGPRDLLVRTEIGYNY